MFWCTQLNLQNLADNDVFAQVIGIESINNLGTHQLRQERLLARRVDNLLLHRAIVRNPARQPLSADLPSDQEKIGVLSSLAVGELKVVHNETRLVSRKRVNKLLPGLFSGRLSV